MASVSEKTFLVIETFCPETYKLASMFTGIIQTTGRVTAPCGESGGPLTIRPGRQWPDLVTGESIAVDGACLSVTRFDAQTITFDAVPETARMTTVGGLQASGRVNLERALKVGDAMGGHYVLGHVDCIGRVEALKVRGKETELVITFPTSFSRFVLPKGSSAINGVSLTLSPHAAEGRLSVYLIPLTLGETNLQSLEAGDAVNLEFDYFGKWVLRAAETQAESPNDAALMDKLNQSGFTGGLSWNK